MDEDGVFTPFSFRRLILQTTTVRLPAMESHSHGKNGTASVTGNQFVYIPDGNFTGTDIVTVEVNNSVGLTTTHDITITVNSVNDLPVFTTPLSLIIPKTNRISLPFRRLTTTIRCFGHGRTRTKEDTYLQLDKLTGDLRFRIHSGPGLRRNGNQDFGKRKFELLIWMAISRMPTLRSTWKT